MLSPALKCVFKQVNDHLIIVYKKNLFAHGNGLNTGYIQAVTCQMQLSSVNVANFFQLTIYRFSFELSSVRDALQV